MGQRVIYEISLLEILLILKRKKLTKACNENIRLFSVRCICMKFNKKKLIYDYFFAALQCTSN